MKKILYVFLIFVVLMAFSCASNPASVPDVSGAAEDFAEGTEEDVSSEEAEPSLEEAYETELEPVQVDALPVLQEIEEPAAEPEAELIPEIEEPSVQEIPSEEITAGEDTDSVIPPDFETSEKSSMSQAEIQSPFDSGVTGAVQEPAVSSGGEVVSSGTEADFSEQTAAEDFSGSDGKSLPEKEVEPPVPSRSMTVKRNQLIDVVYPGKGWIYQENIDEEGNSDVRNKNFIFGGRKLGGENQSFTLRSRVPGKFLLHFYKNDTLTGNYIDDYLEVIVTDEAADSSAGHITAPSYAEVVPPKVKITAETVKAEKRAEQQKSEKAEEEAKKAPAVSPAEKAPERSVSSEKGVSAVSVPEESGVKTVVQTSDSKPDEHSPSVNVPGVRTDSSSGKKTPEKNGAPELKNTSSLSADDLLKTARSLYDEKQYAQAFDAIKLFFDKAVEKMDEGLYLQGQILEAKSEVQNIKGAVDSYDLLVKNYPASRLWDAAKKRSIYLKRFYINIR